MNHRNDLDELLARFVHALNALDLDAFLSLWGPAPSAILPSPARVRRCDGTEEVRNAFAALFDAMRAASPADAPPYLSLVPLDVEVQELSGAVAVVTFHLELATGVGRRTLVLAQDDGRGWSVRHLHASNVAATS